MASPPYDSTNGYIPVSNSPILLFGEAKMLEISVLVIQAILY